MFTELKRIQMAIAPVPSRAPTSKFLPRIIFTVFARSVFNFSNFLIKCWSDVDIFANSFCMSTRGISFWLLAILEGYCACVAIVQSQEEQGLKRGLPKQRTKEGRTARQKELAMVFLFKLFITLNYTYLTEMVYFVNEINNADYYKKIIQWKLFSVA